MKTLAERKIKNENRGFKGIWIPMELWLDEKISIQELLFLIEIDSLDISSKGCYASNKHFADFFGLSTRRCSQIISNLKEKKYISIELIVNEKKQVEKRIIKMLNRNQKGYQENFHTPIEENFHRGNEESFHSPMEEKFQGSNTLFSNTNNNMLSKNDSIPYREIIEYLNSKANKDFKVVNAHKKLIKARWNEGYRLEDFKKVIDLKVLEWTGKIFSNGKRGEMYLKPSTLFASTNLDNYINEVKGIPQTNNNKIAVSKNIHDMMKNGEVYQ